MEHSENRWGCSPITPPFSPPMYVATVTLRMKVMVLVPSSSDSDWLKTICRDVNLIM